MLYNFIPQKTLQHILAEIDFDPRLDSRTVTHMVSINLQATYPSLFLQWRGNSRQIGKSIDVNNNLQYEEYSGTLAHFVAYYGLARLLEALLERGADVNALDQDGNTLVHYAAISGNMGAVSVLLRKDTSESINTKNEYGETPLHCAVASDNVEVINALVEAGARESINTKNEYGETPLHCAIKRNNKEVLKALLKAGADVNALDQDSNISLRLKGIVNALLVEIEMEEKIAMEAAIEAEIAMKEGGGVIEISEEEAAAMEDMIRGVIEVSEEARAMDVETTALIEEALRVDEEEEITEEAISALQELVTNLQGTNTTNVAAAQTVRRQ